MKGIAIGFSDTSKEILKRLKKTEFIHEIYIGSSSKKDKNIKGSIEIIKPKQILIEKWDKLDLIIFIGSIGASIRLITPLLSSKDKDPGVIVLDNKGLKIIPIIGSHQSNVQNIAFQICNLFGGEIIETNNSINKNNLNIDSFGNQWGWKRSGNITDWSKLVIKQANNEDIFCSQLSGNNSWKDSEAGTTIKQLSDEDVKHEESTFFISIFNNHKNTWHPPTLWIGLGCERNTSKELIEESLKNFLVTNNLSPLSIAGFASIDLKKDEQAIIKISKENNWPIKFFLQNQYAKSIKYSTQ